MEVLGCWTRKVMMLLWMKGRVTRDLWLRWMLHFHSRSIFLRFWRLYPYQGWCPTGWATHHAMTISSAIIVQCSDRCFPSRNPQSSHPLPSPPLPPWLSLQPNEWHRWRLPYPLPHFKTGRSIHPHSIYVFHYLWGGWGCLCEIIRRNLEEYCGRVL